MNIELNHPQNFERLVIGCKDSYDTECRLIFQHFSRSTRLAFLCTAQTSKIQFLISTIFEKLNIEFQSKFQNLSIENAISRPNLDENLPEFREDAKKMLKFIENSRKFAKF